MDCLAQEAADVRHDKAIKHVHFIVSLIETGITACVIVVLTLNARVGYIKVRQAIQKFLRNNPDIDNHAHLRSVRTWMWLLAAIGVIYLATCIACFLVFHQLAHLGWTLLSNQVFIITLTILVGFYSSRVAASVARIKEDHHKVQSLS